VKKSGTDANVVPLRQRRQQFLKNTIPQSSYFTTSNGIIVINANLKRNHCLKQHKKRQVCLIQKYYITKNNVEQRLFTAFPNNILICVRWFQCDECNFKTKYRNNLKS
jgi:hypothetical protein